MTPALQLMLRFCKDIIYLNLTETNAGNLECLITFTNSFVKAYNSLKFLICSILFHKIIKFDCLLFNGSI